jgi:hypothetical protein
MSAIDILTVLSERGIRIEPKPPNLRVSPTDRVTPDLVDRIKAEKPALLRALEELQHELGDDWTEIAADPRQLKAAYELQMIVEMREQGIVPDHYTATTTCKHCGPVPIFEGVGHEVVVCPWCFNRMKGLPIPTVAGRNR